ncbi:retrovirus-related pol polyprotein from transposon TNT 1-94 [Tanacetum coccineum]|uniref:Retrovirus-related pol polyprotein from transposon TNT 1-94 n=1 Tax=Tanacetum coccineum TaxID=301880 RepID=A0ABQ5G0Q2_9ASTR
MFHQLPINHTLLITHNRGLRDSNYDQLYAYLKQHEAHANENKMMLDRFTQHTMDPLALMSNGRQIRGQGNNARGASAAGYGGAQNRVGNANPGQARQVKCYNCNGIGHIARNYTQPKRLQNSEYFKDKMLLMQAQENGVALDEEKLLFITGGQDNAIDEDMDEQPVQDLALNVDNVFQADAFDSDVDEAPMAQTMFMTNLSSADPVYDEAGPSYDSDILSEVHDHDYYQDAVCEHHEEHEMHDDVQPNYVVDSHANYTSDSNMIPYVKDNAVPVVQSNVSSVPNDAYMIIFNEREKKIDEKLRIVITDRNIKEENLKKELQSVKMQLAFTINHNKSMVEEVTSLKKDFKQKENKYLEEFLDMKALKEKVEDKLYKQDQSLQTVHMLCELKPNYNEQNKVAIGYNNPLCLTRAKQVQPALYNGYEIIKNNHVPALVHNTEDTLEIARITRKKMNDKMKDPECVKKKVKIAPHDYSKENYLATFTPQTQLTPEHFESIQKALTKEIKEMKEIFEELEAEVDQNVVNKKYDEIERKNLLIANDNLIVDCLCKEVFYLAINSELTVSRFTEMHDAHTVVQARCLELEAELSKLHDKVQKDDHTKLVKRFSNIEVNHLNLQLKYQNLKESFGNNKSPPTRDAPDLTQSLHHCGRVLAPGRYAIDVELVPPHNRNNREVHLDYLKHLKESVETLREIVEEAKVERPLDRSLASACLYTKHSQELLEYVIGTCPKDFSKRDKKYTSTSLTKKKQVTFEDQCEMSNNNIHQLVEQLNIQKNNVPVIPSTGVNSCTDASGSKPRSNTKKNRISPAKSVNKKKVEEHPRTNKSSLKNMNRVDSSIRSKRTVINSNSHSVCKTCNKCLISANHDMCVVNYLHFVNASPSVKNVTHKVRKVWKPKQIKQVWKATGKVLTNVGYQWKPTGRIFTLGDQWPLTRLTTFNVLPVQQTENVSTSKIVITEKLSNNSQKSLTSYQRRNKQHKAVPTSIPTPTVNQAIVTSMPTDVVVHIVLWTVRFGNDHFGAIMSYGDYVIGNSVISRHSCYVRDTDGVELIKGSRSSNLYTISVEDMMKSSPICLLSKASKNKSWLWHHRLNHLNFGTINDLARKDLHFSPKFVPRTPQQNGVVKRQNRTLVEAARTMLIFSKARCSMAEAIAIALVPVPINSAGTPSSTTIDQDAPSPSHSPLYSALQSPCLPQGIAAESTIMEENPFVPVDNDPFVNIFAPEPSSEASSSGDVCSAESTHVSQPHHHLGK